MNPWKRISKIVICWAKSDTCDDLVGAYWGLCLTWLFRCGGSPSLYNHNKRKKIKRMIENPLPFLMSISWCIYSNEIADALWSPVRHWEGLVAFSIGNMKLGSFSFRPLFLFFYFLFLIRGGSGETCQRVWRQKTAGVANDPLTLPYDIQIQCLVSIRLQLMRRHVSTSFFVSFLIWKVRGDWPLFRRYRIPIQNSHILISPKNNTPLPISSFFFF